jgi:hypothetical protein
MQRLLRRAMHDSPFTGKGLAAMQHPHNRTGESLILLGWGGTLTA